MGIMPALVRQRDLVAQPMQMLHSESSSTNISEFSHSSIQHTFLKSHWPGTELDTVGDTKRLRSGTPARRKRRPQVTDTGEGCSCHQRWYT